MELEAAKKNGLSITNLLNIFNQPGGNIFRTILVVSKQISRTSEDELIIRNGSEYTNGFKKLLEDYYLHL